MGAVFGKLSAVTEMSRIFKYKPEGEDLKEDQ